MKRLLLIGLSLAMMLAAPSESQAQLFGKKKKKGASEAPAKPKSNGKIKAYNEVITKEAKSTKGMITTHKVKDDHFFEIADSIIGREILVVSIISGTVQGFNFGGAGMKARNQQIFKWEKFDNKLLLRHVSYSSTSSEEEPIYQSVKNNNFEPIIMSFDIKAYNQDTTGYVIQVDDLFVTDVTALGPMNDNQRKQFGVRNLDKSRSMIVSMKSFPLNTEVRHILTYNASTPPDNGQTNTLSMEMNQSMVLLPEKPMIPRMYDDRVGFFSVNQIDYGLDEQKAKARRYITRWKLEPKDPEAYKRGELVEPVKQIVYYIDPATPEKWRKYLKQGVEDWQVAFEAAGFKNAIIAKDPPSKDEDPDWSPEDVRYSVIRYTANPIQNAMGPHVHDPRSGEIIESDIIWYHNVMNLLRNWYFVQTSAINPDARKVKFDDDVMGELVRFVSAHEVGHTLGFPHNMGASHAYPVDSLRSKTFTEKMGTAPSIMDYARFNYVAQPGDDVALMPQVGPYDKWAAKWGYTWFDDIEKTEDEKDRLNKMILAHRDQIYWYGKQQGNPIDPRAQTEDLGDDAMKASTYGIANLKRTMDKLIEWSTEEGRDYEETQELYGQLLGQWNRYNGHVRANIGGIYETFRHAEEKGDIYEYTPKDIQKRAMTWLQENTFATPYWVLNREVLKQIEGTGSAERIRGIQEATLKNVMASDRIFRLIEAEAELGNRAYTASEMLTDMRNGIWTELRTGSKTDVYRRNLQRAYIEQVASLMKEDNSRVGGWGNTFYATSSINISQSDIQALLRAELKTLQGQLRTGVSRTSDRMSKIHYEDAIVRIEHILNPKG